MVWWIKGILANHLRVKICLNQLQVTTAAEARPLEVVGTVANLVMATSATNLLQLRDVVVYKNLSHPLNLGLDFFRQLQAKLGYEGSQPKIKIGRESQPLLANIAKATGGGPDPAGRRARDQLWSLNLPGRGRNDVSKWNRGASTPPGQISTLKRSENLGVGMPIKMSITTM
ncbi:MAG: hypothetical protein GY696_16315 [Gammaproteobacteria bacterium]|nr:hypothetical protein [Gammaproteobacteria bacterium]